MDLEKNTLVKKIALDKKSITVIIIINRLNKK